jgi:D-hexose-6-phosphate mutarotase
VQVHVEGLDGVGYTDSLQGGKPLTQDGPVVFREEVDRIYLKTPPTIKVGRVARCAHSQR